jgi:hypothetical protein
MIALEPFFEPRGTPSASFTESERRRPSGTRSISSRNPAFPYGGVPTIS